VIKILDFGMRVMELGTLLKMWDAGYAIWDLVCPEGAKYNIQGQRPWIALIPYNEALKERNYIKEV
jgi:hypothetical protein